MTRPMGETSPVQRTSESQHAIRQLQRRPVSSGVSVSARIERTTNQSIPNNTLTAISYQSARFEYGDMVDIAGQPTRITVPEGAGGRFLFVTCGVWAAPASGGYFHFLRLNGVTFIGEAAYSGTFSGNLSYTISGVWDCDPGDYVETVLLQNSGASQNVLGSETPRVYLAALRQ